MSSLVYINVDKASQKQYIDVKVCVLECTYVNTCKCACVCECVCLLLCINVCVCDCACMFMLSVWLCMCLGIGLIYVQTDFYR